MAVSEIQAAIAARFEAFRCVYGEKNFESYKKNLAAEISEDMAKGKLVKEALRYAEFLTSFSYSYAMIIQGFNQIQVTLAVPGAAGHEHKTFHFDTYEDAAVYSEEWSRNTQCAAAFVLAVNGHFPNDKPTKTEEEEKPAEKLLSVEEHAPRMLDRIFAQESAVFRVVFGGREAYLFRTHLRAAAMKSVSKIVDTEKGIREALIDGLNKGFEALDHRHATLVLEPDYSWTLRTPAAHDPNLPQTFDHLEDALAEARAWISRAPLNQLRWVNTEEEIEILLEGSIDVLLIPEGQQPYTDR